MRLLAHLSGAHPTLPVAELESVLNASGHALHVTDHAGRVVRFDVQASKGPGTVRAAIGRLALTREVTAFLFEAARDASSLEEAAKMHPLQGPGGDEEPVRFAVRAQYTQPGLQGDRLGRLETERLLGQALAGPAHVDLKDPRFVVRAWIGEDRVWVGRLLWRSDAAGYEKRAPKNRPYFSPVSGHPALMRAVANLAGVAAGGLVYDPLAGTGGILLEAGLAGLNVVGSDQDPAMVQGTRENLQRFGVTPQALFVADVRDAPDRFLLATGLTRADAVVTDLPYGQASTTAGALPQDVAQWTLTTASRLLAPGGRLVIGSPQDAWLSSANELGFRPERSFAVRIHKSLTRSYHVFRRLEGETHRGAV